MRPDPKHIIDMASAFYDSCILFAASDLSPLTSILGLTDAFGGGSEWKTNISMVQVVDGRWA